MLNDMGILADSVRYYHDADAFTATNLYHVPHAGSYHCDETYGMQRNYLDICQMLIVDEGELEQFDSVLSELEKMSVNIQSLMMWAKKNKDSIMSKRGN